MASRELRASGLTPSPRQGRLPCHRHLPRGSTWTPSNDRSWSPSPAPARRRRPSPGESASSSAPPGRATPPMSGSPASWATRGTPSRCGGVATPRTASPASRTPRDPADRRSFPPEGQLRVISIATSDPADQGSSATRWCLDDIARAIVNQARHEEMSRSTIWRILEDADIHPHKSRYWLNSHDPDFDAKAERICRLYLDSPVLY